MYPRLFWETGVLGQVLYLEAHAVGNSATGIGCFFDDPGLFYFNGDVTTTMVLSVYLFNFKPTLQSIADPEELTRVHAELDESRATIHGQELGIINRDREVLCVERRSCDVERLRSSRLGPS
ncbi:uncharacterized protein LOC141648048 [Silene latifolia]|uniref:uncharacterized protein LOC141648048 n=1 Tax=Silene latifolia TaxID=37657 RepID=UPI003D780B1A